MEKNIYNISHSWEEITTVIVITYSHDLRHGEQCPLRPKSAVLASLCLMEDIEGLFFIK